MYGNNGIILAMCIQILNAISVNEAFTVELFPLKPVVHVGSALELICRVKDCAGDATFTWSALGDKSHGGDIEDNRTVSRLIFSNILPEHSKRIVCKAQCSGKPKQSNSDVQVYSFPTDPVVPRIKHLKANQVQRLNCTIHNIYPAENFKIEWISGDEIIYAVKLDDSGSGDYNNVQNVSSTFNYTPSITDLGKNISCRATLNLPDFPTKSYRSNRTTTLEYGPGTINVSSNNAIVQLGEHLEITCHADGNPQPKILWRKFGESNPIAEGQNEKLVINNASSSQAGQYECEARNEVGSLRMPVNIQVPPKIPKIPLTVELFPLKSVVPVGSALELNCHVKGCPGDASFFWSALENRSHSVDVDSNQTVSRLRFSNILPEHSKSIVCKAGCMEVMQQKTAVVQVYSFPTDPVVPRIKHFKANQVQRLNCTIHNIYPADKFIIEWIRGDETLQKYSPNITYPENVQNFSSTFDYTPSVTDLGKNISCRATLNLPDFPIELYRSSRTTTLEYGPGTVTVSSNSSIVQLGAHLEITCQADGNPQPKILWRKIGESNPIAEGQNEKLVINNASSSQAGQYECEARNEVGSLRMQVIVQVPPKIPKIQLENGVDPREAKNDFGMNISMINVTVKELQDISTTPDLPTVIVPAVGSASLLTAIAVLIRHLRKIKRNSADISIN
ncbi:vascular cell adhesion protein 1 isoform X2 [Paramisgurnus dabryanus]|uniref:vascular cell adhesion protein 1 isoform X2 n=1 Tax=Paramisgurnus dabryanus TaxID=90735 RepID=UPI003CCF8F82